MTVENIFEYAVRNKLRFPYKGSVSVEDLYDLSVTELDKVFKALNAQIKQSKEESLLDIKTREDEVLDTQITIVKHIVTTKLAEKEAREKASEIRAQKQKIMSIIAEKKDQALADSSIEDLEKMLASL